jgi:hypothetical protein
MERRKHETKEREAAGNDVARTERQTTSCLDKPAQKTLRLSHIFHKPEDDSLLFNSKGNSYDASKMRFLFDRSHPLRK